MANSKALWSGRIEGAKDERAAEFLDREWDEHLIASADVAGSIGHVAALVAAGLLSDRDGERLTKALRRNPERFLQRLNSSEDIHSAVEQVLTEELGALGARLHTGRSRNDQVATDLRLVARSSVLQLADAVLGLQEALAERAREHVSTLCPGYTHLQRAQPVTIGYWLLSHAWAFDRDCTRLLQAYEAADVSPLGAGALAGNTLGIDPSVAQRALGFSRVFDNALDAVSDRDFLADALYATTMAATHLSRLGEELVLWSSSEFGFVILPDEFASGSSMMPQKKNPDVAELARAESGAAAGTLIDLLVTLKSVPSGYNRDLQAVKRSLWPLHRATVALRAVAGMVSAIGFDEERLATAAADENMLATDLAEALVRRGVAFRTAHERVASLVRTAQETGSTLSDALRGSPKALAPLKASEAIALLDVRGAIGRRTTPGGPSPKSIGTQLRKTQRRIAAHRAWVERMNDALPDQL